MDPCPLTYSVVGKMQQAPQKLYKRKSFALLESIFERKLYSRFRRKTLFSQSLAMSNRVTDKHASNQEILSVCPGFLDLNNDLSPKIKGVFFGFVNLDKTTGESIPNTILSSLAGENNIDVAFAIRHDYDGASAMTVLKSM